MAVALGGGGSVPKPGEASLAPAPQAAVPQCAAADEGLEDVLPTSPEEAVQYRVKSLDG